MERLHALNQAVFSLYATPDMESLRDRLSQAMESLIEAEFYGTVLRADMADTFVINLRAAGPDARDRFHGISRARLEQVREAGGDTDLLASQGESPEWPLGVFDMQVPLRDFLIGWIHFDGRLTGALVVVNKQDGPLVAEDEEILRALTKGVAEAIENIRLYRELQSRA